MEILKSRGIECARLFLALITIAFLLIPGRILTVLTILPMICIAVMIAIALITIAFLIVPGRILVVLAVLPMVLVAVIVAIALVTLTLIAVIVTTLI